MNPTCYDVGHTLVTRHLDPDALAAVYAEIGAVESAAPPAALGVREEGRPMLPARSRSVRGGRSAGRPGRGRGGEDRTLRTTAHDRGGRGTPAPAPAQRHHQTPTAMHTKDTKDTKDTTDTDGTARTTPTKNATRAPRPGRTRPLAARDWGRWHRLQDEAFRSWTRAERRRGGRGRRAGRRARAEEGGR